MKKFTLTEYALLGALEDLAKLYKRTGDHQHLACDHVAGDCVYCHAMRLIEEMTPKLYVWSHDTLKIEVAKEDAGAPFETVKADLLGHLKDEEIEARRALGRIRNAMTVVEHTTEKDIS